jgi:hypothetical protein
MYDTNANHGFLVRDATEGSSGSEQQLVSRENTQGQPQLVVHFAPDTVAPETTIDSKPEATTTATTATFAFSSSEPGSTYECSVDGGAYGGCTSPKDLTGLSVGSHTFHVRAIDQAGNTDPTPAGHTWTVEVPPADTTAPDTTIDSQPDATTTSTAATFAFSSSELGSTYQCSREGAAYAACTSPQEYTGLSFGSHTFEVRAIDQAGNVDPTPATSTWTVQADCATTTVSANADSWTDQATPSTNKGTDTALRVRSLSGSQNQRTLVRFALPAQAPEGCVMESATLRLYASSAVAGRAIRAVRLASTWAENTVTWSSQPMTTGTAALTTSAAGWLQWTVTAQVEAMLAPGANHGFLVRDGTEGANGAQQFNSRESAANQPELVIRYAPVS